MTTADPLLTDLFKAEVAREELAVLRLQLARLQAQRAALEAAPVASTKVPPKPQRWYLHKRWLLSAIFLALLLLGYDQREKLLQTAADYIEPARGQVGPINVDGRPLATAIIDLSASRPVEIVPTPPDLPQATPQPTIGTGATVPQEPTGTPVAAQEPRDNGQHDVQEGNAPAVNNPVTAPTVAPPPPTPAPAPPAQPTAAPTAEPPGDVVAQSQDAPVGANGEPQINYEAETAKWNAVATAQAFQQQLQQQGFRP